MDGALRWCDSHCHLDDERTAPDAIAAARAAGVERMITVGTDAARSRSALALAEANENVWATVGLHPHDAIAGVATLDGLFDHPKVVAVGECGLDYHYDHSPRDVQREAFATQIALAHELGLALVIHTRAAWDVTFAVLGAVGVPARTIFHCFTGGAAEARRCLDLGAYLSFSGIVTFPSAADVREAAALCPSDRLLVETDSPYLAPVPHRGRTNSPALVPVVGAAVAAARAAAVEDVAADSFLNAAVAFGLPRP
jgi:TatD DNase family protein